MTVFGALPRITGFETIERLGDSDDMLARTEKSAVDALIDDQIPLPKS